MGSRWGRVLCRTDARAVALVIRCQDAKLGRRSINRNMQKAKKQSGLAGLGWAGPVLLVRTVACYCAGTRVIAPQETRLGEVRLGARTHRSN